MTETLILQRRPSSDQGTFGQIFRNGQQICVTCEPIEPFPAGLYLCIPHNGPKFKNVWEITDVPGHTAILIHAGNTIKDTSGCVLVGNTYGTIDGLKMNAVMNSRLTLDKMRRDLPDQFYLYVRYYDGD